jgi:hypothetical protein
MVISLRITFWKQLLNQTEGLSFKTTLKTRSSSGEYCFFFLSSPLFKISLISEIGMQQFNSFGKFLKTGLHILFYK